MIPLRSIREEKFAYFGLSVYIPVALLLFYVLDVTVQLRSGIVSAVRQWSRLWCCSQPVLNSEISLSRVDSCALACSGCASMGSFHAHRHMWGWGDVQENPACVCLCCTAETGGVAQM